MIYGLHRWTATLTQIANELSEAFMFMARPEGDGKGFHHVATACFIIRKITESAAHSHHNFRGMQIKARKIRPIPLLSPALPFEDRYDFSVYDKVTLSIRDLCNHVVHSHIYSQGMHSAARDPKNPNGGAGWETRLYFRVSSENEFTKKGAIYEIEVPHFVDLIRRFAEFVSPIPLDRPLSLKRRWRRIRIAANCWSGLYPLRKALDRVHSMYFAMMVDENGRTGRKNSRPLW